MKNKKKFERKLARKQRKEILHPKQTNKESVQLIQKHPLVSSLLFHGKFYAKQIFKAVIWLLVGDIPLDIVNNIDASSITLEAGKKTPGMAVMIAKEMDTMQMWKIISAIFFCYCAYRAIHRAWKTVSYKQHIINKARRLENEDKKKAKQNVELKKAYTYFEKADQKNK